MNIQSTFLLLLILLISCFDIFEPNFENIEEAKLRVIGSRLNDPNVLPGDTISMKVFFAGNEVVDVSDWKILYGYMFKMDGDERIRRTDYEEINVIDYENWLPDSIEVTIVIDSNIIVNQAKHAFPTEQYAIEMDSLVQEFKKSNGTLFESFSEDIIDSVKTNIINTMLNGNILFTAKSKNGSILEVKKNVPITYRKEFNDLVEDAVNPEINWLAIYSVPDNYAKSFYPLYPQTEEVAIKNYLFNSNYPDSVNGNVIVQKGWSYFLVADPSSSILYDDIGFKWFLQNSDIVDDDQDSLFVIDYDFIEDNSMLYDGWYTKIIPPVNKDMKNFDVWVYGRGSINYINGYDVKHGKGVFKYQ